MPVIRFAGLYPAHAIVRPPSDPSLVPPVVEYHDLRILAEAAGLPGRPRLDAATVRAIAAHSLDQLRSAGGGARHGGRLRPVRGAVVRADAHPEPSRQPGLRGARGPRPGGPRPAGAPVDPGRPLLDAVHAPREAAVIEAWGLDEPERPHWVVGGAAVEAGAVREAHLAWYAAHPDAVQAGLARHADALRILGLA